MNAKVMVEKDKEASDTVGCTLYSCWILKDDVFDVVSSGSVVFVGKIIENG